MADCCLRLVATDESDTVIHFIDEKHDGHIHFLDMDPDVCAAGRGSSLLLAAVATALERGVRRVFSEPDS